MMVKVHQTEKNHQCINVTRLMLLKKKKSINDGRERKREIMYWDIEKAKVMKEKIINTGERKRERVSHICS